MAGSCRFQPYLSPDVRQRYEKETSRRCCFMGIVYDSIDDCHDYAQQPLDEVAQWFISDHLRIIFHHYLTWCNMYLSVSFIRSTSSSMERNRDCSGVTVSNLRTDMDWIPRFRLTGPDCRTRRGTQRGFTRRRSNARLRLDSFLKFD